MSSDLQSFWCKIYSHFCCSVWSISSSSTFNIFSLSPVSINLIIWLEMIFFVLICSWSLDPLKSVGLHISSSLQIFFSYYFFKYFSFSSFSSTLVTQNLDWMLSSLLLSPSLPFSFIFSVFSLWISFGIVSITMLSGSLILFVCNV